MNVYPAAFRYVGVALSQLVTWWSLSVVTNGVGMVMVGSLFSVVCSVEVVSGSLVYPHMSDPVSVGT